MLFAWDDGKNRRNLRKHGLGFETAALVFDDPYALTRRDDSLHDEERWITLGAVGLGAVFLVVHTHYETHGEEVIRIISARAAEPRERKSYEEANQITKARNTGGRRKKRCRY